jgi:ASC-1-like (ASCH) protein
MFAVCYPKLLPFIEDGSKTLEIRLLRGTWKRIKIDDSIDFSLKVTRKVVAIRHYDSPEKMLREEDPAKILPGKTANEILALLRQIYPNSSEKIVVFELELIL